MVRPLARTASDHVPYVVSIATTIPKARIFRFENYWVDLPGFFECVEQSWNAPTMKSNSAARLTEKFKRLRYALKHWYISLSKLKKAIEACNQVVMFFDNMEELRTLTRPEFNFRKIVKLHVEDLLHLQFIYWKQRCTIRWIKVGEENSKFFQVMDTERFSRNSISSLQDDDGNVVSDHQQMAGSLIEPVEGLNNLSDPFLRMK
ncbi:uncharacterized protein [Aegilops tauschii subsp. strangulata]|uniref:uncharacterized protein n=1 Tax=Aegilops tauschii subsp. strangulata TaxID=200361 RepID=UPI003CC8D7A8